MEGGRAGRLAVIKGTRHGMGCVVMATWSFFIQNRGSVLRRSRQGGQAGSARSVDRRDAWLWVDVMEGVGGHEEKTGASIFRAQKVRPGLGVGGVMLGAWLAPSRL